MLVDVMWSRFFKWLIILLPVAIIVAFFLLKGKLENYAAGIIKNTNDPIEAMTLPSKLDSLYNYAGNGSGYQLTFLEFGATGCVACRKMEFVLEEVRQEYPGIVKVEFLNILQSDNQALMKHFGVVAIPTQVLLDREGNEFFRHTGYYSFNDLRKVLTTKLQLTE
jgi:thioredoxin 1